MLILTAITSQDILAITILTLATWLVTLFITANSKTTPVPMFSINNIKDSLRKVGRSVLIVTSVSAVIWALNHLIY